MPRYTSAYSSPVIRLKEVTILVDNASRLERKDPMKYRAYVNACCRGAIVLLCSHLEGYIEELGTSILEKLHSKKVDRSRMADILFYHISRNRFEELFQKQDPKARAEWMFEFISQDLEYWSKSGRFANPIDPKIFNKGFATPRVGDIAKYLKRFGYNDYIKDLNHKLTASSLIIQNTINHMVDTRNSIAHGDNYITKTPTEVSEIISSTSLFCNTTDVVLGDWCKRKFCSIR